MVVRSRCALLGGSLALAFTIGIGSAPADATTAGPQIAPYFELSGTHLGNLQTAIRAHGLTAFTAAFVLGAGCTPTWDDGTPIASATSENKLVTAAQKKGATAILSFGGAGGTELAASCTTATSLVGAYTAVITKFGVSSIDFDIEGAALTDSASIARRFVAIKTLETKNPTLAVSLTVPVGPGGLDARAVSLLNKAKKAKVRIDLVNIMAMDYGPATDMGAAAISAAQATLTQVKNVWPATTYGNIGITPMIGQNDSPAEQFDYSDATDVVAFAQAHGIGRLAFWNLNRDQQCTAGETYGSCSTLTQSPLDFTDAFTG